MKNRTAFFVFALATGIVATPADALAQAASPTPGQAIVFVAPPDDVYIDLIVATTGWAKKEVSKSLGVLQREDAPPVWQRAIDAAAKQHDLKSISLADYTIVCRTRQASRSAPAEKTCAMKGADAVLQFSSVLIAGDSGFVGMSVSRVPKNHLSVETKGQCLALVRRNSTWEAVRAEMMMGDVDRCPRNGG